MVVQPDVIGQFVRIGVVISGVGIVPEQREQAVGQFIDGVEGGNARGIFEQRENLLFDDLSEIENVANGDALHKRNGLIEQGGSSEVAKGNGQVSEQAENGSGGKPGEGTEFVEIACAEFGGRQR